MKSFGNVNALVRLRASRPTQNSMRFFFLLTSSSRILTPFSSSSTNMINLLEKCSTDPLRATCRFFIFVPTFQFLWVTDRETPRLHWNAFGNRSAIVACPFLGGPSRCLTDRGLNYRHRFGDTSVVGDAIVDRMQGGVDSLPI